MQIVTTCRRPIERYILTPKTMATWIAAQVAINRWEGSVRIDL
jgi:hypothetical protein